jgi:hypothetical protein
MGLYAGDEPRKGEEMRLYREIVKADIGETIFTAFGGAWPCSGFIGRILPQDVGKRVYLVGRILQVENNEQRDKRIKGATP